MFQIIRELVFELITPNRHSSGSVTQRITRLDHKLRDDPMEDDTLEKSTARMSDKVFDRLRCVFREETDMDVALARVYGGGFGG